VLRGKGRSFFSGGGEEANNKIDSEPSLDEHRQIVPGRFKDAILETRGKSAGTVAQSEED